MGAESGRRINHPAVAMLGLVTIAAYGSWYYAFGVLLDPIRLDTGWGEAELATSFSVGSVALGIGSLFGGRILDRVGSRTVLLLGSTGGVVLALAGSADNLLVFAAASALAMGVLGSFGFYHNTMTMAVRINPSAPASAISVLTIWGAFASVIHLPMTAALVERLDWRDTTRIIGATATVIFLLAAVVLPPGQRAVDDSNSNSGSDPGAQPGPEPAPGSSPRSSPGGLSLRQVLAATISTPERRAFTVAVALGGMAMSTVLVYQVGAMTAAGLPLTTAATMAGVRGFAQTGGRIPLGLLVRRFGSSGSLAIAFAALAIGGVILAVAGSVPPAIGFAIVTGFGIGAFSPLQGITAEELFDRDSLGATMGSYSMVLMVAGAAGPAVAGVLADSTGDRRVVSGVIAVTAVGAMLSALRLRSRRLSTASVAHGG